MSLHIDPTEVQLFCLERRQWGQLFRVTEFGSSLKATVAITDNNIHEIRFFSDLGKVHSIDIRLIKKLIIRNKNWFELTDKDNRKLALSCLDTDPNFRSFSERLITLVRLLKVKFELTDGSSKYPVSLEDSRPREVVPNSYREPPELSASPPQTLSRRPLPPPPPKEAPPDERSGQYDYVISRAASVSPDAMENGYLIPNSERINKREEQKVVPGSAGTSNSLPNRPLVVPAKLPLVRSKTTSESFRGSWFCSLCTLENSSSRSQCSACERSRNPDGATFRTSKPPAKVNQSASTTCLNCDNQTPVACLGCQVEKWRCRICHFMNSADAFMCGQCERNREDAWQCHVCQQVVSLKVTWCRRCDVWRCRLCQVQNDARENDSNRCKTCEQITF